MSGDIKNGEGVVNALRMHLEDTDDDFDSPFGLDNEEAADLLAYVESLERQVNAHPPAETDPDV